MNIILADPDRSTRTELVQLLHWTHFDGHMVGSVCDGAQVLSLLSSHPADVVVAELHMPYMDGLQLAEQLQRRFPHTRMVLISQQGDFACAQQAMRLHVRDYLLKPVSLALVDALERRLVAIRDELHSETPPWYLCDEVLRERVGQALHAGDMDTVGELLVSQDVAHTLSGPRDQLGLLLLNYLFSYQGKWGENQESLESMRRESIRAYWKLSTQQDRLTYLAAQYYDLMESIARRKDAYDAPVVAYCLQAMQDHFSDPNFNISNLANSLHVSLAYLSTVFKRATNQTLSSYLSAQRLQHAQRLLQDPTLSIQAVCHACGFHDPHYFSKFFKKHTNMTPSAFRNLHAASSSLSPTP